MADPLVSVAMTCFNCANFLEEAIGSIAAQTWKNWELIIVDDRSVDNSPLVIKTLISKFGINNKTKFIQHNKNLGYGGALKRAVEEGKGELVAIVDGDDALASRQALSKMVKKHAEHPNASLVYSNYWQCRDTLKKKKRGRCRALLEGETYLSSGTRCRISHLKVFKRSAYKKTPGVNGQLLKSVDKDLVLKLEEVGDLVFFDELLYYYRKHPNNLCATFHKMPRKYKDKVNKMRKQSILDAHQRRKQKK